MTKKRFAIPTLVLAAAVALIVLLVYGVSSHADTQSIDARVNRGDYPVVPGYASRLPLLGTDRSTSLASFKGKMVMLNVYASWCPPCHAEAPLIASEQKVLAAHGAMLVGLTYEDGSSGTEGFDRRYGLHEPVLRDVSGNFVHGLGTYGVPETFLIDPKGRIIALRRFAVTRQWLDQIILPLLKANHA